MQQKDSHQLITEQSQQQLALDIFGSAVGQALAINDQTTDFSFRKAQLLVDVGSLSLLARRSLNACYFIAQENPTATHHTVDERFFKWLIRYDSNNKAHLKKVLQDAQNSKVLVNIIDLQDSREDSWVSVQMLGAVGYKRGKLVFKIPTELHGQLRDPERYSLLSMRITAGFTSIYALELYERALIYKHETHTPWYSLDEFRSLIKVDELKSANDFRYFKRDIIEPAVKQINEISDIELTLELKRTGRFYSHLRFEIKPAAAQKHVLAGTASSRQLYNTLTDEFGLSDAELSEITKNRDNWTDERLHAAIAFVRHRMTTSKVTYPAKYLMNAIRAGYRIGSIEANSIKADVIKKVKAEATQVSLELARAKGPALTDELPNGQALDDAWHAFKLAPASKLFKSLPQTYSEASNPAKQAFRGFLSANR